MKLVGIGDLLIDGKCIRDGFAELEKLGVEIQTIEWNLEDYEEMQHINLLVEQGGAEVYNVPSEIIDAVKEADIIITQFCPITQEVMRHCPNLKAIGVLRGGTENVNVDYAKEQKIKVFNTPGRNANAVADFTVGILICECRNIAKSHVNMKKGKWIRDYTNVGSVPDLNGKTVGIVGLGLIGRKVAKRLEAFDMKIIAYDPFLKKEESEYELVELEELMQKADFITLHARMTKETEGMISEEMIRLMKPTAYLINTARSGLVDEDALASALTENRIAGAALDVYDLEPPMKDYKLVVPENVTLTPHMAGGTRDAFTNSPVLLAENMCEFIRQNM